jgi:hypothetical protein
MKTATHTNPPVDLIRLPVDSVVQQGDKFLADDGRLLRNRQIRVFVRNLLFRTDN